MQPLSSGGLGVRVNRSMFP